MRKGLFIVVEGLDGSGKTTAVEYVFNALQKTIPIHKTREPGGTPFAEKVRNLLKDPVSSDVSNKALAFLVNAARVDHHESIIRPKLATGISVVTDRYISSTLAYQGCDPTVVQLIALTDPIVPDFVIYMDVDPSVAAARCNTDQHGDWMDSNLGAVFEERTQIYRANMLEFSTKTDVLRVDANQSLDVVKIELETVVLSILNKYVITHKG